MENSRRTAHLDLGQSASLEPGPSLIYTFYYYCPTHFPRLASLQFQFSAIFRSLPDLKVAQSPKLWRLGAFLTPISHRKSFQFNYQTPRHFFLFSLGIWRRSCLDLAPIWACNLLVSQCTFWRNLFAKFAFVLASPTKMIIGRVIIVIIILLVVVTPLPASASASASFSRGCL